VAAPLVLVVEDEPGIATILVAYLERDGLRTLFARDGEQAVQLFRQHQPDLVLLDIHLPGMDGVDVLRFIRDQGQTPVIMVTALADDVDKLWPCAWARMITWSSLSTPPKWWRACVRCCAAANPRLRPCRWRRSA